jgi:hypothetical protein
MVGARANAAMSFARQLHYEAANPGDFHLHIARTNAADLERLAREIQHWVDETAKANSAEQNALIEPQLKQMREEAQKLEKDSAALGKLIDGAIAAGKPTSADETLRTNIAQQARDLFQGFRRVMGAHKEAEEALGIPTPSDPPASESASG